MKKKTIEEFIEKSKEIHGEKYDYSKVEYVGALKKVLIICKVHGKFLQRVNNHLLGIGCPKCSGNHQYLTEEFIFKARQIHGEKYDYSEAEYVNSKKKITIICKLHGKFLQSPNKHLQTQGCPFCQISKGEDKIREYLSLNNITFETQKTFNDCYNKYNKHQYKLRFDFYLPVYNTMIEFDGEQHFKPIYFGRIKDKTKEDVERLGLKNLKHNQKMDNIKNEYCLKNKINLIRIPYTERDNIEKILDNLFNKNGK